MICSDWARNKSTVEFLGLQQRLASFRCIFVLGNVRAFQVDLLPTNAAQSVVLYHFKIICYFGSEDVLTLRHEDILVSVAGGLINGGFGGLVWEYIFTAFAFGSVVITMAEMTSMAPTSGGQYHWISEFSPPRYQKYLSYAAGWTSALGWLTDNASGYFILSTLVEALVEVYDPDWSFTRWQSTLVMIFFLITTIYFNTWGAKLLPGIEIVSVVFHMAGFVITIVPLWVLAPKNSASDVFGGIVNGGGWSNAGTSFFVGTITILFSNLGPDAAVHIGRSNQVCSKCSS